ncbi:coproporphyrinogen III oxidase [Calidifontibacillus oryziterrae]|uniref:coproporphyrinogen III oxidase n=1 Tax=Calidifontibacillus oryziterrae TaxID=1191699 RepID=UPI0003194BC9|nr:coproporphyrinogen III oxidase [Calidifontibacillus oryziterrae]
MRIQINEIDSIFFRDIQLISQLFFEDCLVSFTTIDAPDLHVTFTLTGTESVLITADLLVVQTNKKYHSKCEKENKLTPHSKEWKKVVKHAVNFTYLDVLQKLTGIIQKWGTLTGVRPIKLLHKKLTAGLSYNEARQSLQKEYMIQNEKIELMQRVVSSQLKAIPDLYSLGNEVSIYIGIPFCPTKCAYCTFPAYAINGKHLSVSSFLGGLHYEIQEIGKWLKQSGMNVTTVYFGGGTPTSITEIEMDLLYDQMYQSFPNTSRIREITVEAGRPDTITVEKLKVLKKWGIDRISINPQSYIQETLKAIGRHHTVEETIEKFKLARQMGMKNINMDLIIGLPGEGINEFEYSLRETANLMPESLTVHTLSFKRASEMTKNKQKYKVAGREEIINMMNAAVEWTNQHGYEPYYLYRQKNILGNLENVGYSLKGHESLYNIIIMEEQQTILGLGCGASSKFVDPVSKKITRFANPKDPKTYNDGFKHYTNEKIKLLSEMYSH